RWPGTAYWCNGGRQWSRLSHPAATAWGRTRRQHGEGAMAKVLGGVRRPKAVFGILVGLLGLLVTVGSPAGAAELAPTMPPTPPIELRSPVAPEAGIRSVDYDSWIGPHVINVMPG